MRQREIKIFSGFMKSQWAAWVIVCLAAVIFFVLDRLGKAPSSYIVYGIFLLIFLTVIIMLINYVNYRRRVIKLMQAYEHMSLSLSDLPAASDCEGEYYGKIIAKLYEETSKMLQKMNHDYVNQIDYYSMWVHQIKTPIAALRLMVQSDASLQNKLAWQTELFKIEQYVSMVLMYVRLSDLSQDMVLEPVDVRPLVSASVKKYSTMFIYKRLAVDIADFNL